MRNIKFNCPSCDESVGLSGDQAGQLVDCPHCGAVIEVPYPRQLATQEMEKRYPSSLIESRKPPAIRKSASKGLSGCLVLILGVFGGLVLFGYLVGEIPDTDNAVSHSVYVSKDQFGSKWPLTVDGGRIECIDGFIAVIHVGGMAYALNGAAESRGYSPINPIWRDNPDMPGLKVDIGPLIALASAQGK